MNKNKGMGIFSLIIIIAILAIAGFWAIKASQDTDNSSIEEAEQLSSEEQQAIADDIKEEVSKGMTEIKTTLASDDLDSKAKVDAVVAITTRLSEILSEAKATLSGEPLQELTNLESKVKSLGSKFRVKGSLAFNTGDSTSDTALEGSEEADQMDTDLDGEDSTEEEFDISEDEELNDLIAEIEADLEGENMVEGDSMLVPAGDSDVEEMIVEDDNSMMEDDTEEEL